MPGDSLLLTLLIIALVALWYGPIQWAVTDVARQYAFECRERLFDMAADGEISFESREYREIRVAFERLIRFAHEATTLRLLLGYLVMRRRKLEPMMSRLSKTVDTIPDVTLQKKVRREVQRAAGAIGLSVFIRSPICLVVLMAIIVCISLYGLVLRLLFHDSGSRVSTVWRETRPRVAERIQIEAEHAMA